MVAGVASQMWILLILLNIASQTLSMPYYYHMCEPNSNSRLLLEEHGFHTTLCPIR